MPQLSLISKTSDSSPQGQWASRANEEMLNHLFAFLDTQLVEPPWSLGSLLYGSESFPPTLMALLHFFPFPVSATRSCAFDCGSCDKSERALIQSREGKNGFKRGFVTEDLRSKWAEQIEELLLMWRRGFECWYVFSVNNLIPLFSGLSLGLYVCAC